MVYKEATESKEALKIFGYITIFVDDSHVMFIFIVSVSIKHNDTGIYFQYAI